MLQTDVKSSPFKLYLVNKQQINFVTSVEKQNRFHADFTFPLTANILKGMPADFHLIYKNNLTIYQKFTVYIH